MHRSRRGRSANQTHGRASIFQPGALGEAGGKRRAHNVGLSPGPFARFVWPKQRGFTVAGAAFGRHAPTTSTRRDLWLSSRVYKGSTKQEQVLGPSQRFASWLQLPQRRL